jgi:uncharacterized membrane protein YfcA
LDPLLVIIGFIVYFIANITGAGYGTILSPLLVLWGFNVKLVVPGIVTSQLIANIVLSALHHWHGNTDLRFRSGDLRLVTPMFVATGVGALVSSGLLAIIPGWMVEIYLGIMLIFLGIIIGIASNKSCSPCNRNRNGFKTRIALLSLAAVFNKGITGGGVSPLLSAGQVLLGVDARKAVSLTPLALISSELVMVLFYLYSGLLDDSSGLIIPLTIGALLAAPLVPVRIKKSSDEFIRKTMSTTLIVLGFTVLFI